MKSLLVTIPTTAANERGDYADVFVNDSQVNSQPIEFFPGSAPVEPGSVEVTTHPLYCGEHAVRVEARDILGNLAPEGPVTKSIVVDTGPTPPRDLDFLLASSLGLTFAFVPSPELASPAPPIVVGLEPFADATIDAENPSSNYGAAATLDLASQAAGPPAVGQRRSVLAVAIDSIPRAALLYAASLKLYCVSGGGFAHTSGRVYACEEFAEGVACWTGRLFEAPFYVPWAEPGAGGGELLAEFGLPHGAGEKQVDLTATVAAAVADGAGNLYLLLRLASEASPLWQCAFGARDNANPAYRPVLEAAYSVEGYVLYRGATRETVDFDTPVGFAAAGASEIAEWTDTKPTGSGTYVYCLCGVGPGGVVTPPHESAYYEVEFVDGERVPPPPAAPVEWSISPHGGGQVLFVVTVDRSLGQAPPARLCCLEYDSGLPGEPTFSRPGTYVDVPEGAGRYTLHFALDPGAAHGATVGYCVRAVSASDVEEGHTEVRFVEVDSEGPAAPADFTVEVAS